MIGISSSCSGSGVCVPEGAESYMDSAAVAYDTADISDSARDSGLSWPPGSGVFLNADGGVGVTIIDLGGLALAGGGILEVPGVGLDGDDELDSESATGGDNGAVGSCSGLDSDTGSMDCIVSATGTSCRLSLDNESLRERCCCISRGDSVVSGKPAKGDEEVLAALTLTLGTREVDPVPW